MKRYLKVSLGAALVAASAAAMAAEPLRIGLMSTLSGPGAAPGVDIRDGFELVAKLNGGTLGGVPVEISVSDDRQSPDTGRQAVERYIKRDKVDILTGISFSNVLLPVLPAILESDTIYINSNTGPENYAGKLCNPLFFNVAWAAETIPAAMGQYAKDQGFKKVFVVAPNYPGGRESVAGFKRLYDGEVQEVATKLGQLDYAVELSQIRMAKPDAVFFFLPGGMGVNFIKQFNSAGLDRSMALLTPGFSADEDTIKAVGEPMLGLLNTSQWSPDMQNPENVRFVEEFHKAYGRYPTLFAAQAYDAARLIDGAVKAVGGNFQDRPALLKALKTAPFQSVRGDFRFNTNQYPVQNYYLRKIEKDDTGRLSNRLVETILTDYPDPFVQQCPMS